MENKRGAVVSVKNYISDLSEDLYLLQQNDILCDVILEADDGNVSAHAVVVSAASSYLKRIITSTCVCTPNISVSVPEFSVECLKSVLRFMYTGKIFVSTSNIRSIKRCFNHFEMYSELKKVMKNFTAEEMPVSDKNTGHKENKMLSVEEKKGLINIPWSERLRNALRENNDTNIIQASEGSEEILSDELDVLKKSVEAVSMPEKAKDKLEICKKPHSDKTVGVDINTAACSSPNNKMSPSVDVNSCDRYSTDINSCDRYNVDINSCDRYSVDTNSCDRYNVDINNCKKSLADVSSCDRSLVGVDSCDGSLVDVNSCDKNTFVVNGCNRNKDFSFGKRHKEKIKRNSEPVAKIPKLHKHSCRKLMSKIRGDFHRLFVKTETGFPEYKDVGDSSSTCESDILNEYLNKDDYTTDTSDDCDDQPPILLKGPDKIEEVSGMQKSLDFVTDSKNRQHFFSYQNKMVGNNEKSQVQNSDLEYSKEPFPNATGNVIDDSLSSLSEDIGLLGVALSQGFSNKELISDICVDPKTQFQNTKNITSPMSEMSANYTSESYLSQASLLSDISGNHVSHFSDTIIDQVPVSPDVCTSQVSCMSESSTFHNPMLSDASTDHERDKGSLKTNEFNMSQKEKYTKQSGSLLQENPETDNKGGKNGFPSNQQKSSLVSTMDLLESNDIENQPQCNLDSSYNFCLSSEILNTYQQTETDGNPNAENPANNNIYIDTTDLSGHHIVEHFENIDQLEMTPELLEAVVNPEFVQHFNNENVVSVGQSDVVSAEQQGSSTLGQEEQIIGQICNTSQLHPVQKEQIIGEFYNSSQSHPGQEEQIIGESYNSSQSHPGQEEQIIGESYNNSQSHPGQEVQIIGEICNASQLHPGQEEQIIGKSYSTNQAHSGEIIIEVCNSDQIQSNEIVINSENLGNIVDSQKDHFVFQSHDAALNTNCNQSQEIIIQAPNEIQLGGSHMEHIIIEAQEGTEGDIQGQLGQIIIETEDGTILKTGQVADNIFDRIENCIELPQKNNQMTVEDELLNEGSHEKVINLDCFKQTAFKKITRCRTCNIDFLSEMAFKIHRKKVHPLAHCTWLRRSQKRKQLEQLYSKIEEIKKLKTSQNHANFQTSDDSLRTTTKDLQNELADVETDDDDDDNEKRDATYIPYNGKNANKFKGTTRCRTCKIDFHNQKKFQRHRKEMHPVAHITWLKRKTRQYFKFKASEKFKKRLSAVDTNGNGENEKAVNELGKIIEKIDESKNENEDVFELQKDFLSEYTRSDDDSDCSDITNEYDSKILSSAVNLTSRIRRVTYCRTCAINFETTDQYRLHREKVHPLAHKNWLARNAVKERIKNLIKKKSEKSIKRCKVCGDKFPSPLLLMEHHNAMHPNVKRISGENEEVNVENNMKCQICGEVCSDSECMKKHMDKFHPSVDGGLEPNEILECDVCDFTTKEIQALLQHENEEHKKEIGIETEPEEQKETEILPETKKNHCNKRDTESPLLSCCLCPFEADSEQEVISHVQNVHSTPFKKEHKKGLKCTQCDYMASNHAQLNGHMIRHTDANVNKRFLVQCHELNLLAEQGKFEMVQAGVVENNDRLIYLGILQNDLETFTFCEQPIGKLKGVSSYILNITEESCQIKNNDEYIINSNHLIMSFHCQFNNGRLCLSRKIKKEIELEIQNYLVV